MKRVLIIAYYFPPLGMGGVQRALKFCKYLPDFGWEPVVITVKDLVYRAYDPDLLSEIPHLEIIRTESLDPLRVARLLSPRRKTPADTSTRSTGFARGYEWLMPWLFVPDPKILWVPFAIRAAEGILRKNRMQAVLTTSPPHSAHLVGYALRVRYGLPWVADFRDDWLREAHERPPTEFHLGLNAWIRRRILSMADRVVAVSPQIAESLGRERRPETVRPEVLYNGFDAADFAEAKPRFNTRCTITYVGTLNPILDPTPFFRGVSLFLARHSEAEASVQIRLVGGHYGLDLDRLIRDHGLESLVVREGYVPHRQAVQALMEADLLLFLMSPALSEGRVPGKLFEYLGSGKPILAVVPESEAGRLIRSSRAGWVIRPEDPDGIAEALREAIRLWKEGRLGSGPGSPDGLASYERRAQTRRLAELLDGLSSVGSAPFRAGGKRC